VSNSLNGKFQALNRRLKRFGTILGVLN